MASLVSKVYYCSTSSFPGTTFGELAEASPPATNTTWGWETGRVAPPVFYDMCFGFELSRTASNANIIASVPSQSIFGFRGGNCWMAGPFDGGFVAGNWMITMSVRQVSGGGVNSNHTGIFNYRFWTCPTGSGVGAVLVNPTIISSSILNVPASTATTIGSCSFYLPTISLHNEYLFIQTWWNVLTPAGGGTGNNVVDNDFVLGGGSASMVYPTAFMTQSRASFVVWNQDRL